jgi:hypothetical protein
VLVPLSGKEARPMGRDDTTVPSPRTIKPNKNLPKSWQGNNQRKDRNVSSMMGSS